MKPEQMSRDKTGSYLLSRRSCQSRTTWTGVGSLSGGESWAFEGWNWAMEGGGRSFELGDMTTACALGQGMWAIACGAFVGKAAVRVGAMAFTAKGKAIACWKGKKLENSRR